MSRSVFHRFRSIASRGSEYLDVSSAFAGSTAGTLQNALELEISSWRHDELSLPRYSDPRALNRFEQKVYSQDGGDGILREIFRRVGEGTRYFVEFGIGNGLENNSAFLVVQEWSGLWIDGDLDNVACASQTFKEPVAASRLTVMNSFITAENIESLFAESGVPEEPALVSIDIDGNDYWIWKALESYRPRVVEVEYNSMFPADCPWVMAYNPQHQWGGNSYFGASLKSLTELASEKGYVLVACAFAGTNAFFVREDLVDDQFVGPFRAEALYQPARYFLLGETVGHPRAYGAAKRA